jgi:hypothetical protein
LQCQQTNDLSPVVSARSLVGLCEHWFRPRLKKHELEAGKTALTELSEHMRRHRYEDFRGNYSF